LKGGKLALPLEDLLHGDAGARINADDGSAPTFYLASWALYRFLRTTKDTRFANRFDEWESFALGSRWKRGKETQDAATLFDRLFGDVKPALELSFVEWIGEPK
jgi:hypothetical protein